MINPRISLVASGEPRRIVSAEFIQQSSSGPPLSEALAYRRGDTSVLPEVVVPETGHLTRPTTTAHSTTMTPATGTPINDASRDAVSPGAPSRP